MKTSNKLKERLDMCGFECEGDDGTLVSDVALLEDVVEVAKKIDLEWYIDYDLCPKEIVELHDALAKLELLEVLLVPDSHESIYLSQKEFDDLGEYSASYPTGQIIGKCWKAHLRDGSWVHREYLEHPTDDKKINIRERGILIVTRPSNLSDDAKELFKE